MRLLVWVLGVVVVTVLVVVGIGYALPVSHRATRAITVAASPDSLFSLVSNSDAFPTWRSRVKRVERVARNDSVVSYREIGDDGDILYAVDESVRPKRLRTRIADSTLPFGGTWTFDISARNDATELRITEDGEVYNPLFRFMSRFVFGHHASIETYLKDADAALGGGGGIRP
jgi:uncharacterized protein YndB with AHSA1/START domain